MVGLIPGWVAGWGLLTARTLCTDPEVAAMRRGPPRLVLSGLLVKGFMEV